MRVGFIGLGNMGRPMAARLIAARIPLIVNDINRAAAEDLLESGAEWGATPHEVAEQSAIVCTSLLGPIEAEAVFLAIRVWYAA